MTSDMHDTTNYAYGSNVPGYLPENPVRVVSTFDEAKRGLIGELKWCEDYAEDEAEAETFCAVAEDVNLWSSAQHVEVSDRVFFVMETTEAVDED